MQRLARMKAMQQQVSVSKTGRRQEDDRGVNRSRQWKELGSVRNGQGENIQIDTQMKG